MRMLTRIFLFLLVLGLTKLNTYTKSPHLTPAESHVLKTITYGVGAGLVVNTACGMMAPNIDPDIPSSDSFISCAPFGLAGSIIVARVYVFATGGWGLDQWWYLNQLPRHFENGIRARLGWELKPPPPKPMGIIRATEALPVEPDQVPPKNEL